LTQGYSVADHLEVCDLCVAVLDEVTSPPVQLPSAPGAHPPWDERRMRRSVRRTVLRTALHTVLLFVLGFLVLQLLGWYVVHPLLIDRGDRLSTHLAATIDVPVMTIPGAALSHVNSSPGVLGRTTEVELQRAVGARQTVLGTFTTRVGPRTMSVPAGTDIGPRGPWLEGGAMDLGRVPFAPERLAEGTAVTVELSWYDDPLDVDAADAVADGPDDLTLLWVGFRIPGGEEPMDPYWRLGYSACGGIPTFTQEQRRGGFGGSGDAGIRADRSGAQHALTELRRATANLAAIGWPAARTAPHGALADLAGTAEALAEREPAVSSVVITGPTQAVADAIDGHAPDEASLLELDLDRGAPATCG
jgi:hypothetical protein